MPGPHSVCLVTHCRRRLELFGEDHNIRPGWVTVGKNISNTNFRPQVSCQQEWCQGPLRDASKRTSDSLCARKAHTTDQTGPPPPPGQAGERLGCQKSSWCT